MEMSKNEEQIDSRYIIKEKIGEGLKTNIFLVLDKKTNKEYVSKVFKEGEKNKALFNNEIKILNILKKYKNPYIINIIDSGEGNIIKTNKKDLIRKYSILEYASNGNIFDYIYYKKCGFGELYSKIIFSKIMEGVKFFHEHDICHRDLKIENILLDKEFFPKICNFSFGCINSPDLKDFIGNIKYSSPQIWENIPYDGKKEDIFSLGALLMVLVTGLFGFKRATKNDLYYKMIKDKDNDNYWKIIKRTELSDKFKDLYLKMVAYNPNSRPNAEEVLNHSWFNEIKELNLEQRNKLKEEIRKEFTDLSIIVKEKNQQEMKAEDRIVEYPMYKTRCFDDDDKYFMDYNIRPKCIVTPMNVDNYIKIKGYLNPVKFMNFLCEKLVSKFKDDNCYIKAERNKLEINIIFEEDEEDEEEEEKNENIEESNDLSMQIKLYEEKDEHLLRFILKKGNRKNFLDKYNIISKLVEYIIT